MSTLRRLDRLDVVFKPIGCDACRCWSSAETIVCDEAGVCTRPELCRACGRHVPIHDVITLVGVDLSAL